MGLGTAFWFLLLALCKKLFSKILTYTIYKFKYNYNSIFFKEFKMFSKFAESTGVILIAFTVITFSAAMVGNNSDSQDVPSRAQAQVPSLPLPAADYSDAPIEYAANEVTDQPVHYISFPPMHIIVTPDLNN
jgi:hypothetical protein